MLKKEGTNAGGAERPIEDTGNKKKKLNKNEKIIIKKIRKNHKKRKNIYKAL